MAQQTLTPPTIEEFKTMLKRHGLKATRQRLAVHEVMMGLVHASAEMVKEELSGKGVQVTFATVYNILSGLADERIYGRRLSATSKMFFDVIPSRHIHLYDRENHTYRDIADEELNMLVASHLRRRKFRGYSVEDIDIQLIAVPTKSKSKNT